METNTGTELTAIAAAEVAALDAEDGQTMAEYALILTGIALAVMVAALALGGAITAAFNDIIAEL